MALMYISTKPSPGPVHPSCPIQRSPAESKGPEVGSLTAQSPEVGLKPERCAVLPWAEDGLSMLICAVLAGRTHLQMRAMSLRVALLQPSHSSRAPALVVRFKVIQYQTH